LKFKGFGKYDMLYVVYTEIKTFWKFFFQCKAIGHVI